MEESWRRFSGGGVLALVFGLRLSLRRFYERSVQPSILAVAKSVDLLLKYFKERHGS